MGKHARKRQRTAAVDQSNDILGVQIDLNDDGLKDDEERKLESLLFGKPYVPFPSERANTYLGGLDDEDAAEMEGAGAELEAMLDADVRKCRPYIRRSRLKIF